MISLHPYIEGETNIDTVLESAYADEKDDLERIIEEYGLKQYDIATHTSSVTGTVKAAADNTTYSYDEMVMQKGDRKIVRHPLCVVFATMNPRTEGTMPMNEAFVSRMRHPYRMEEPSEQEFVSILAARTGEEEGLCRSVYRTYKRVRETIESYRNDIDSLDTESVLQSLSIRACCAAIEDIQEGCTLEEAIESSIIGLIAVHNEEMAGRVSRAVRTML